MEMLQNADFWIGLMKIVWINIILSGDNAVVIALAARSLPEHQQRQAIMIKLMTRFPIIVTFGACLIGWVGGETIASDVALREFSAENSWLHYTAATTGALVVLAIGKLFQKKHDKELPTDAQA
ncbi:MAG: hypothetical protein RJA39_1002 [Pseudomonadota bacterium]|jgi:predicted tellurium resistance membrane protein TerC